MSDTGDQRGLSVFLVAAEELGDQLGAALMQALRQASGGEVKFAGIGGRAMAAEGMASLIPIERLALFGFGGLPRWLIANLRSFGTTADAVLAARTDVLVIIDCPDFSHRVARRVRARQPTIPIVNYVSPQVWVWRPKRAAAMRSYIDHVLALLPFEPAVHARLGGPPCTYVGHPIIENAARLRPNAEEARRRQSSPPRVLVLPGSRRREIDRLAAVFGSAIDLAIERCGPMDVVLPTVPHLFDQLTAVTAGWANRPRILVDPGEKYAAFRTACAALAASGTVTLELGVSGVPTVVAYRGPPIDRIMYRLFVRMSSIVLANLVIGENVMPEFLQDAATPERLATALVPLLSDTPERRAQTAAFARLDSIMDIGGRAPSAKAADIVLEVAARSPHRRREIG